MAVQLQKNLDRVRLRRVAAKMKKVTLGGYTISSHPSGAIIGTKNMREVTPDESSDEEEMVQNSVVPSKSSNYVSCDWDYIINR